MEGAAVAAALGASSSPKARSRPPSKRQGEGEKCRGVRRSTDARNPADPSSSRARRAAEANARPELRSRRRAGPSAVPRAAGAAEWPQTIPRSVCCTPTPPRERPHTTPPVCSASSARELSGEAPLLRFRTFPHQETAAVPSAHPTRALRTVSLWGTARLRQNRGPRSALKRAPNRSVRPSLRSFPTFAQ